MDVKKRATRFKEARENINESLRTVDEKTGISKSTIHKLESEDDSTKVNYVDICTLADHYKVNVAWLMGQSDSPSLDENIQIVTKTTGLSNEAINMIKSMKDNKLIDSLNKLLESEDFSRMVRWYKTARIINQYCTESDKATLIDDEAYQGMIEDTLGQAVESAWFPGESQIDMCLLRATNTMMKIFETIMKEDKNNGKRNEENK